ncbi:acetyltransferase (GNAT) family protein [Murinocardiopsis flavida]|uniref:Acetyltransferase (GNAT) family protein n=1 Tax=Murinocardiopsis flavida TaxID=645275 RepID=A0A2P8DEV8_9ACTN|nr:GNAT family N-acetyltransferase [Murinocardiopsis flavida]PSK95729.1 acetyltransferase (GNAT) family protein [Murinocardiopsis flavida]
MAETPKADATDSISVHIGAAELAVVHHNGIRRLYDEAFLRPPFAYTEGARAEHEAGLARLRAIRGFGIAVAVLRGEPVGFAYGFPLPVDHQWWDGFPTPLPRAFTREWPGRTLTIEDLAVDSRYRRSGVARRLLAALLDSRGEERAVLSVQPAAEAAHAFYRATGWHKVGRKGPIPGIVPPYWDIYTTNMRRP